MLDKYISLQDNGTEILNLIFLRLIVIDRECLCIYKKFYVQECTVYMVFENIYNVQNEILI